MMKINKLYFLVSLLVMLFILSGCPGKEDPENDPIRRLNKSILKELINNEYRLHEHYIMVNKSLKQQPPFTEYEKDIDNRLKELEILFEKYEMDLPKNRWKKKTTGFKNIKKACMESHTLEKNSVALYDRMLKRKELDMQIRSLIMKFQYKSQVRLTFLRGCSGQR